MNTVITQSRPLEVSYWREGTKTNAEALARLSRAFGYLENVPTHTLVYTIGTAYELACTPHWMEV